MKAKHVPQAQYVVVERRVVKSSSRALRLLNAASPNRHSQTKRHFQSKRYAYRVWYRKRAGDMCRAAQEEIEKRLAKQQSM